MKIDPGSLPPTPDRISQSPQTATRDGAGRPTETTSASGDAVQVSSEAQLVADAAGRVGAVGQDQVRPDVVARAQEALARGEVGTDLERLADRLIDGMLDE